MTFVHTSRVPLGTKSGAVARQTPQTRNDGIREGCENPYGTERDIRQQEAL